MDFEICVMFIIGYLITLSKSQTRMQVYYSAPGQEYRRYYTISSPHWMKNLNDIGPSITYQPYGTPMTIIWYPSNSYYSTLNHIPKMDIGSSLSKYFLYYKNPFLSHHQQKEPKPETSKDPKKNEITDSDRRDFARGIFFEEYPHLKSLLQNQKIRIDNELAPYKLGSLRNHFHNFRP